MSLINRMLLDLDARQEQHNARDDIINDLQPVAQNSTNQQRFKIASLAATCLALIAVGLIYLPLFNQRPANPTNLVSPPVTTSQTNNTTVATTDKTAALTSDNPPLPTTVAKHETSGDKNSASNTLISHSEHNARPSRATPASSQAPALASVAPHNTIVAASLPVITRKTAPAAASTPAITTVTLHKKQRLPETKHQAEQQYDNALRYFKQGRMTESVELFHQTLQTEPGHIKAREVLGSLLMQQLRWQDAERVLVAGIELKPSHLNFNHLLARLKIEQGHDEQAITLLEKPLQQGNRNAKSSALLALLYQRQGRHADASQFYKRALIAQPNRGKWWLGLAISLEAQQHWGSAAKAYRLAAASDKLEPQLQQYARQRRQAINGQPTSR